MRSFEAIATLASIALLPAGLALAQAPPARMGSADTKHVRVTIENLTTGQAFSPSVFMSHNASAPPLFKEGDKASFGLNAVNAYEMSAAKTVDLSAMEAGTEKKAYLVAMMGTERDPEGGVVQKHSGIRGDADAPAEWKFDPAKPVARITITPVTMKATQ